MSKNQCSGCKSNEGTGSCASGQLPDCQWMFDEPCPSYKATDIKAALGKLLTMKDSMCRTCNKRTPNFKCSITEQTKVTRGDHGIVTACDDYIDYADALMAAVRAEVRKQAEAGVNFCSQTQVNIDNADGE